MPLSFKQMGLLTLQVAVWEACTQVNSNKCRAERGYSLIASEWKSLFDLIHNQINTQLLYQELSKGPLSLHTLPFEKTKFETLTFEDIPLLQLLCRGSLAQAPG